MRTTIDLPESLLIRVKGRIHKQKLTLRSLVISALERILEEDEKPFELRDASVGKLGRDGVPTEEINRRIDEQRVAKFQP